MKHLGTLVSGLLVVLFAACSTEEPLSSNSPVDEGTVSHEKDVYASLTLRLPSASRAVDINEEVGQKAENNVGKVLVVLATKDANGVYKFLTKAESDAKPNYTDVPTNTVKYVLNFSSSELQPDPLDKETPGSSIPSTETKSEKIYVFAYCNPSPALLTIFDESIYYGKEFTDIMATVDKKDDALMWQDDNFLMTNWKIVEAGPIPTRDKLINEHNTPQSAFHLGTVEVKRAAARFDFQTTTTEAGLNKYAIKDIDGDTEIGVVELTDMAMFNIAKKFYYLPRTSSVWTWDADKISICSGREEEDFVVSNNTGNFKQQVPLGDKVGDNFFSYLINNPLSTTGTTNNSLKWYSLKNWNSRPEDNPEWSPVGGGETDYHIWRYASENTIPANTDASKPASLQKIGITTGVVFKGEFVPTTDISKTRWNGNAVYLHKNVTYGDFQALKDYVSKYPQSEVAADFAKVSQFENVPATADPKKSLIKGLDDNELYGFKAYEPNAEGKYVMYYFYYNRHNTNGIPSVMGENEFGVVRNNVYKLKVTACGTLGEPEAPSKPDDPDEKENAYFSVNCLVLPWTVRVNDIIF